MLNILSVGITSPQGGSQCACAYNDALRIYNIFSEICANKFSTYNSLCVNNLKSEDYLKFLDVLQESVKDDDIFVLYFSGHGELCNDKFYLRFFDNKLSLNSIKEKIDEYKGHIVVILDCCFAGGALSLANRNGLFHSSHISVLASSNTDATSKYDVNGSLFTRYLVWALRNLYLHREELTLNSIVKKIDDLGYKGCNVNVEEGEADLN